MAPDSIPTGPLSGSPLNAAISDAVARVLRQTTGRGPTRTSTSLRDNVLVVVLEDALTTAERTLLGDGKGDEVLEIRESFQGTLAPALVDAVERLSGRRVIAFMSANHIDPDIATETFVFEPLRSRNGDRDQVIEEYDVA
jgi:uncharacterized protein YbcI